MQSHKRPHELSDIFLKNLFDARSPVKKQCVLSQTLNRRRCMLPEEVSAFYTSDFFSGNLL